MHLSQQIYDVTEPLRPVVDDSLLTLLEERTFAANEFFETRQGVVRLMPPLPQVLAEMSPKLAKLVGPVVEGVTQRLAKDQGTIKQPVRVPTLLSEANRSAGRDKVRTSVKREGRPVKLDAPAGCRECGVVLEDHERHYCDECLPAYRDAQTALFKSAGRERLQDLRASGIDPSQTGAATDKRRAIMKQRRQEELEWDAADPDAHVDEEEFAREIAPGLQGVSLSRISAVTGLSQQYCSPIRRGAKNPAH